MNHKYISQTSPEKLFEVTSSIGIDFSRKTKEWWLEFIELMKEHFDTLRDIETTSLQIFEPFKIKEEIISTLKHITLQDF